MSSLIPVAIALAAGLLMTRVVKVLHLNFPDVTAFLLAGLAIGPFGLGKLASTVWASAAWRRWMLWV